MSKFWKYPDLDQLERLYPSPHVVLNHYVWWTLKYDGSCICVWFKDGDPQISSRNLPEASEDIQNALKRTTQFKRLIELLEENPSYYCFGELLIKGRSPTRIELHKRDRFIGFDIRDASLEKFLAIPLTYQVYHHFKIPTPPVWAETIHADLDSLLQFNKEIISLAKKRQREGVVAKTTDGVYRWKTKVDRPIPKIKKKHLDKPQLPPLPESEAFGAVDKVFVDIGLEDFKDKRKAMPLVAQYINKEMLKHNYGKPRVNFYYYYTVYLEERLKEALE